MQVALIIQIVVIERQQIISPNERREVWEAHSTSDERREQTDGIVSEVGE